MDNVALQKDQNGTILFLLLPAGEPGSRSGHGVVSSSADVSKFVAEHCARSDTGYVCLVCGTGFASRVSISVHARDMHVNAGVVYLCPACKKYCNTKNAIKIHISRNHPHMKGVDVNRFARKKQ